MTLDSIFITLWLGLWVFICCLCCIDVYRNKSLNKKNDIKFPNVSYNKTLNKLYIPAKGCNQPLISDFELSDIKTDDN